MSFASKGSSDRFNPGSIRRDTRSLGQIIDEELFTLDGSMWLLFLGVAIMFIGFFLPFGGEIGLALCFLLIKRYGFP